MRAAKTTRTSATESAIGQFIGVHTQRLATLAQLHTKLSLLVEGGAPDATRAQGIELRGTVEAAGVNLDDTLKLAEAMIAQNKDVTTNRADTEIVARIQREKKAIALLPRSVKCIDSVNTVPTQIESELTGLLDRLDVPGTITVRLSANLGCLR
jgi:hypothetical protein